MCSHFHVDTLPPSFTPTPPDSARISNPAPLIRVVLSDFAGAFFDSLVIHGTAYRSDNPAIRITGDTVIFTPSLAGIDTLDTSWIRIYVYAHDGAELCGVKQAFGNWDFYINISAPNPRLIMPFDGSVSACSDQNIRFILTDTDGIDSSSVILNISGHDYRLSDSELFFIGVTHVFAPSSLYTMSLFQ